MGYLMSSSLKEVVIQQTTTSHSPQAFQTELMLARNWFLKGNAIFVTELQLCSGPCSRSMRSRTLCLALVYTKLLTMCAQVLTSVVITGRARLTVVITRYEPVF